MSLVFCRDMLMHGLTWGEVCWGGRLQVRWGGRLQVRRGRDTGGFRHADGRAPGSFWEGRVGWGCGVGD